MESIFTLWPTAADLARDLGENPVTVRAWKQRNSIPAKHDIDLVRTARARGHNLTLETIAEARLSAVREKEAATRGTMQDASRANG